jgi:hypothetical protein
LYMRLIIAQRRMALLGGSETFVLTMAEHLAGLGHEVFIQALEFGMAAGVAKERALAVVRDHELPIDADATIALDRVMAVDLAARYPDATRLYAMHNSNEVWLPPPEPGIVLATLAANDRLARLARSCTGAGEVIRIRQPIDLRRFSPRGWARKIPQRVLLLGNYLPNPGQRANQLQDAWSRPGLEWHRIGLPEPSKSVAEEISNADIVVGYGRSILEAMACGRPAYIHEYTGSDGWVTAEAYHSLESDGFAGMGLRRSPDISRLREDFLLYEPALGRVGQDLIRMHHDARLVVADIVEHVNRLRRPIRSHDRSALRALRNLAESHLRADLTAESYRFECMRLAQVQRSEQEQNQHEKSKLLSEIAELREMAHSEREQRKQERTRRLAKVTKLREKLRAFRAARRFALAQAIFWPLDRLRSLLR